MVTLPQGSIYFWMYEQGLKRTLLADIENACYLAGKEIRQKDYENYWNGYHNSILYHSEGAADMFLLVNKARRNVSTKFIDTPIEMYPMHPCISMPEVQNRWVPCSQENKPLIKWSQGCMTVSDAVAYPNQVYLAENLKGTQMIVIDCDGDHEDPWDYETMAFLHRYASMTHCIEKPHSQWFDMAPSFHLTFKVERIIPTMHFPYAHMDIVGNRKNSLRYLKNKKWNGLEPALMTPEIWNELRQYVKYRKEKADA